MQSGVCVIVLEYDRIATELRQIEPSPRPMKLATVRLEVLGSMSIPKACHDLD